MLKIVQNTDRRDSERSCTTQQYDLFIFFEMKHNQREKEKRTTLATLTGEEGFAGHKHAQVLV